MEPRLLLLAAWCLGLRLGLRLELLYDTHSVRSCQAGVCTISGMSEKSCDQMIWYGSVFRIVSAQKRG